MGEQKKRGRGHPRTFKSGEELIALYREFCDEVKSEDYKVVPTKTEFEWWLKNKKGFGDRKTVYWSLERYYPEFKKEFDEIRADVVSQGTMLGKYQPSMSIFALKNWCGWSDKQDIKADTSINVKFADSDGMGD